MHLLSIVCQSDNRMVVSTNKSKLKKNIIYQKPEMHLFYTLLSFVVLLLSVPSFVFAVLEYFMRRHYNT